MGDHIPDGVLGLAYAMHPKALLRAVAITVFLDVGIMLISFFGLRLVQVASVKDKKQAEAQALINGPVSGGGIEKGPQQWHNVFGWMDRQWRSQGLQTVQYPSHGHLFIQLRQVLLQCLVVYAISVMMILLPLHWVGDQHLPGIWRTGLFDIRAESVAFGFHPTTLILFWVAAVGSMVWFILYARRWLLAYPHWRRTGGQVSSLEISGLPSTTTAHELRMLLDLRYPGQVRNVAIVPGAHQPLDAASAVAGDPPTAVVTMYTSAAAAELLLDTGSGNSTAMTDVSSGPGLNFPRWRVQPVLGQGLDMLVDDVDTTPAKAGSGIFVFFELLLFAAAQLGATFVVSLALRGLWVHVVPNHYDRVLLAVLAAWMPAMFVFAVCTLIPLTLLPRYHYYRRVLGTSTFPVLFTVVLLLLLANSIIVPSATLLWLADPHPITEIPSSVFSAIAEIALQGGGMFLFAYMLHVTLIGFVVRVLQMHYYAIPMDAYFIFMGAEMAHMFILTMLVGLAMPVLAPLGAVAFLVHSLLDKYYFTERDCYERPNPEDSFTTPIEFAISYITVSLALFISVPVALAIFLLPTDLAPGGDTSMLAEVAVGTLGVAQAQSADAAFASSLPIALGILLSFATALLVLVPPMRRQFLMLYPPAGRVVHVPQPVWFADGPGLVSTQVGVPAKFTLQKIGGDSKPAPQAGDVLTAQIKGGEDGALIQPVTLVEVPDKVGLVDCTYMLDAPAEGLEIAVMANGSHVDGSPFLLYLVGAAVPPQSTMNLDVIKRGIVGQDTKVVVTTRAAGRELVSIPKPLEQLTVQLAPSGSEGSKGAERKSIVREVGGAEGRYKLTCRLPEKAGMYDVWVGLNGEDIHGSPFVMQVDAGSLYSGVAYGEGLKAATAQEVSSFVVRACDKFGNVVGPTASLGAKVSAEMGQLMGENVKVKVQPNADGSFNCEYVVTGSGAYALSGRLNETALIGSPFRVDVTPCVDPASCRAEGSALRKVAAGENAEARVLAKSKDLQPIELRKKDNLRVFVTDKDEQLRHKPIRREHVRATGEIEKSSTPGQYRCFFRLEKAGVYWVFIVIRDEQIHGSPFELVVEEGEMSPDDSIAVGQGVQGCRELEAANFQVITFDRFKNRRSTSSGAAIDVKLRSPTGRVFAATAVDKADGTYDVSYTVAGNGQFEMSVLLAGRGIQASPFNVNVLPAADAVHSTATGPGVTEALAGEETSFLITTKTPTGEVIAVPEAPKNLTVLISNESGDSLPKSSKPVGKLEGDAGRYTVTYTAPEKAGKFWLAVLLRGEHISGSPFQVPAAAGAVDPMHCVASGEGLRKARAFRTATFKVELKDKYDNVITTEGRNSVHATLRGRWETVPVEAVWHPNPGYICSYMPTNDGDYEMLVTVNGEPIQGSPFKTKVLPGAEPPSTIANVPKTIEVGTQQSFAVTCRNRDGEQCGLESPDTELAVMVRLHVDAGPTPADGALQAATKVVSEGRIDVQLRAPESAGPFSVAVMLRGQHIHDSPFQVLATVGPVHPPSCLAAGEGTRSAVAHAESSLTLQAADKYGNRITSGGPRADVSASFLGTKKYPGTMQDNGDGTYTGKYTPQEAGRAELAVSIAGGAVHNSPFTVDVAEGAEPDGTVASGYGIESVVAGERTSFRIATATPSGRTCAVEDIKVLQATTPTGRATISGDGGQYEAVYTAPVQVGTFAVDVQLRGKSIRHSPYTVAVGPGELDAIKCTANGPGLVKAMAYVVAKFKVTTADRHGLQLLKGGNRIEADMTGAGEKVQCAVEDNDDGTYQLSYMVTGEGGYQAAVKANGEHIKGSPFAVKVAPPAHALGTKASGSGIQQVVAGKPAKFQVHTFTRDGDAVDLPILEQLVAWVGDVADGSVGIARAPRMGLFDMTYTAPEQVGSALVSVTLRGEHIVGSTYDVEVVAAEVDGAFCTASGPGLEAADEGIATSFQVVTFDSYGNAVLKGGAKVEVVLTGGTDKKETVKGTVSDNKDGSYTGKYTVQGYGTYEVAVAVAGKPIRGSPFSVYVMPGARASACEAYGPGLGDAVVGVETDFTVIVKSPLGNAVELRDASQLVVSGDGIRPRVEPTGAVGEYSVTYSAPTKPNKLRISVTLKNQPINGSPFEVPVFCGKVHPPSCALGYPFPKAKAFEPTTIQVISADCYSNLVKTGAQQVQLTATGTNETVSGEVTDLDNGAYDLTFVTETGGAFSVDVTINGEPVKGSPFDVKIVPAAHALYSTASGAGISAARAGERAQFQVTCKTELGNAADLIDMAQLQADLGDECVATVSKSSGTGVGVYYCEYTAPEQAGEHMLNVTVRDEPIVDAPFIVEVSASAADGMMSEAYGPGLEAADGFEQTEFTVVTSDRFGNRIQSGGAQVAATASNPKEKLSAKVQDLGDGSYKCTYTPTGHGEYLVDASVNGDAVKDSPFTVQVTGGVDAQYCEAEGTGLREAYQGLESQFTVTTKNGEGDMVACDPKLMEIKVMGKSDEVPTKVDASQADSGLFEVSYNSERYYSVVTISVKVRGQDVPGSPFSARMKEHPMHELYNLRAVVGVEIQVDAEPSKGVRLLNVRANSPAQRAGMVIDADFIYAVQGKKIENNLDFEKQIKHHTPGDMLRFDLVNENDVARTVTVELGGAGMTVEEVRELRARCCIEVGTIWDRSQYKRIAHTAPKGKGKGLTKQGSDVMVTSRPVLSAKSKSKLATLDRTTRKKVHAKLSGVCGSMNPKDMFNLMDQDGSGTVAADEFLAFVREECKLKSTSISDKHVNQLFDALDGDDSGAVDCAEIVAFITNRWDA